MKNQKAIKTTLLLITIGLAGFTIWFSITVYEDLQKTQAHLLKLFEQQSALVQHYSTLFRESEASAKNIQRELDDTKKLYSEAQVMLSELQVEMKQTKDMLTKAQEDNQRLKDYSKKLKGAAEDKLADLKGQVTDRFEALQTKNKELKIELEQLQEQIGYLTGDDIKDPEKAESLLKLYRTNIKLVKDKLRHFRRETQDARAMMLAERDRLKAILGNHGFLIKAGEYVEVDFEQYEAVDRGERTDIKPSQGQKPKVDVTFVDD